MNKKIVTLLCSLFLLSGCSTLFESKKTDDISSVTDEEGKISEPLDINTDVLNNPDTKYDPSVLLVKTSATSDSDDLTDDMKNLGIKSIKSIAPRSEWKKTALKEGIDALSVIKKFRNSGLFDMVDFDYIYDTEEVKEETTVSTSTIPTEIADYQKQVHVDKAWKYLEDNGKAAGGDSSVIVAVIDTGVDYNHIDLKQNIWINKLEIPGNGIDDDDNGYV
ncbi:MAG: S8 family serine peptidase, partial [Candidatus Enterosoma sp.]|nr:S8 family serine peptidase [Candidatus Enterosoma sp.]